MIEENENNNDGIKESSNSVISSSENIIEMTNEDDSKLNTSKIDKSVDVDDTISISSDSNHSHDISINSATDSELLKNTTPKSNKRPLKKESTKKHEERLKLKQVSAMSL